jgi:3'-phosphoadenosine 5'-phosphosulfate (PAPS) 3'-phosphatase
MHYSSILPDVLKIADAASEKVLSIYMTDFKVEYKSDESPITAADLASHRVIVEGLRNLSHDIPVLSEEGAYKRDRTGRVRRVSVVEPGDSKRVVASKNHLNDETKAFIEKLGDHELVQAGSSLKFCKIAEGHADIYPRLGPACECALGSDPTTSYSCANIFPFNSQLTAASHAETNRSPLGNVSQSGKGAHARPAGRVGFRV